MLAIVIAVAGALFAVTQISSNVPTNSVELAASKSRKPIPCPAISNQKVTARSKLGTYVDKRGATQHHGDGQGAYIPVNCAQAPAANAGKPLAAAPATNAGNATGAVKAGTAQTVKCPTVEGALPAIPASAQAEVTQNLALLNTQIDDANKRLAELFVKPEGGANFVQNTVIGPLKDKRFAVLNRIATAIGRTAARPENLNELAACTVNEGAAAPAAGGDAAANPPAAGGDAAATPPAAGGDAAATPPAADGNNGGNNNGGNNGGAAATTPPAANPPAANPPAANPGLGVLANDCSQSKLAPHDGFQNGNRCVSTSFGELAEAAQNPSLLIQNAPQQINAGQNFTIDVSTRNLVRDRFLAAGQGGYYVESSLLNDQGLVRGHFHTACRMLQGNEAQDPAPAPAFFVATEDGSGGAAPDTVKVTVAGLTTPGTAQCASWAGDGSHRVPMMQRANQIPAFDVVRIQVN
jgi:hypothetical protein